MKKEKVLLQDQSLLIWDEFKVQATTKVKDTLAGYGIE